MLYRSVYSEAVSRGRISRTVGAEDLRGSRVVVDGFNVLSVVLSSLERRALLLGTDGFVRDVASLERKLRVAPPLLNSLVIVLLALTRLEPGTVVFYYDSQVSRSALAAVTTREVMARLGIEGGAELVSKADKASIAAADSVVCSADSVILDSAAAVFDLGGYVARRVAPENVIDFREILSSRQGVVP